MEATIPSLIAAAERGDASAAQALFSSLYKELHQLAKRQLARRGATNLGTTTLLHEAYLGIAGRDATFQDRAHFMGYAARVMRGLIIDHARSGHALKRGGLFEFTALDTHADQNAASPEELTRISDALDELAKVDPPLAELVDLKFFCGFSLAEIAQMREVSERTVQRNWEKARIYLSRSLRDPSTLD